MLSTSTTYKSPSTEFSDPRLFPRLVLRLIHLVLVDYGHAFMDGTEVDDSGLPLSYLKQHGKRDNRERQSERRHSKEEEDRGFQAQATAYSSISGKLGRIINHEPSYALTQFDTSHDFSVTPTTRKLLDDNLDNLPIYVPETGPSRLVPVTRAEPGIFQTTLTISSERETPPPLLVDTTWTSCLLRLVEEGVSEF
ncbi:unnamed protein product [Protopolystoma xenopodis]|uniref:Uncharacterized protein n=1 Tax=Protopolystoma xenopodis TaxID=117903 RepID=A0A3S5CRQ3_9PLAT|nr:unnamed protein product [Protopolystoma xenopodis]